MNPARLWLLYKQLVEAPSGLKGWRKACGIGSYVLCGLGSVILVTLFYNAPAAIYISAYSSVKSDYTASPSHRLPDLLFCPSRPKHPDGYRFNVW